MVKKKLKKSLLHWDKTCQKCGKRKATTAIRTFRTKDFMGPCGDSFCYASCNSPSCHSITVTVCAECEKKLKGDKDK